VGALLALRAMMTSTGLKPAGSYKLAAHKGVCPLLARHPIFMAEARVERRPAAILAAASSDVNSIKAAALAVTFARLMSVLDERASFALLRAATAANALCILTSPTSHHFAAAVI
jgi:hypothetical protein